jgi:hypothetical protein
MSSPTAFTNGPPAAGYRPNVVAPFPGDDTWGLAGILKDVKQGCADGEKKRAAARELQDWYDGDSEKYVSWKPSEDALSWLTRPKRVSFITRQAVKKLTSHLYKPGPRSRKVTADDDVDAWYRRVAQDIQLNALMKRADELVTLQGLCAVGMYATGDASRPVNYHLYERPDFDLWCDPKDPRLPVAICCVTKIDATTTRYRLWTAHCYYTFFRSKSYGVTQGGWGVARYDPAQSGPHGYGCLPFVIISHELPTTTLETKGVGYLLAKINRALNIDKSNLAHWVHHYGRPIGTVAGVGADWRFKVIDGGFVVLPARQTSVETPASVPVLSYLQANLDIVGLRAYIAGEANAALAELDVPLSVHTQSDGGGGTMASSGLALQSQDSDLITYAKGRQPTFDVHEQKLMALACRVGCHDSAMQPDAFRSKLRSVAADPGLRVVWPETYSDMPSRDRDDSDTWELTNDLTDPIELLMRRQGLTEPEAVDAFRNIQRRKVIAVGIVAEAQAALDDQAGADDPTDPAESLPPPSGDDRDPGDMGIKGPMGPSAKVQPAAAINPTVSVATPIDPQADIPAGALILAATPGYGGFGTEA